MSFDIKKELMEEESAELVDDCHEFAFGDIKLKESSGRINLKLKTEKVSRNSKMMLNSSPFSNNSKDKEIILSDEEDLLERYEAENKESLEFWSYLEKCADDIDDDSCSKAKENSTKTHSRKSNILSDISGDENDNDYLSDITSLSSEKDQKSLSEISQADSLSEVSEISLSSFSDLSEDESKHHDSTAKLPTWKKLSANKFQDGCLPASKFQDGHLPANKFQDGRFFTYYNCDLEKMKNNEGYQEVGSYSGLSSLLKQIKVRDSIIKKLFGEIQDLISYGRKKEYVFHKAKVKEHKKPRQKRELPDDDYYHHPSTSRSSKYPKMSKHYKMPPMFSKVPPLSPAPKYQNRYQVKLSALHMKERSKPNYKRAPTEIADSSMTLHLLGHKWVEVLRLKKSIPESLGISTSLTYIKKDPMETMLKVATEGGYSQCNNIMVFSVLSYAYKYTRLDNQPHNYIVPNNDFDFYLWRKWVKDLYAALIKSNRHTTLYVFIPPRIKSLWNTTLNPRFKTLSTKHPEILPENLEDYGEKLTILFSALPHLSSEKGPIYFDGQEIITCKPKDSGYSLWLKNNEPTEKYSRAFWNQVAQSLKKS